MGFMSDGVPSQHFFIAVPALGLQGERWTALKLCKSHTRRHCETKVSNRRFEKKAHVYPSEILVNNRHPC